MSSSVAPLFPKTSVFIPAYWATARSEVLTQEEADTRYLKFPTGQGTESIPNLIVSGTTTLGITTATAPSALDNSTRVPTTNWVNTAISASTALINLIYPVGSIFQSSVSTNPGSYLTGTTWIAYGAGQVLVGKAASGTFVTAGSTGGAETTTISANNLPLHSHPNTASFTGTAASHTHIQDAHLHLFLPRFGGSAGIGVNADAPSYGDVYGLDGYVNSTTATNQNTSLTPAGSVTMTNAYNSTTGTAISNLQPYIVVYIWTRTA